MISFAKVLLFSPSTKNGLALILKNPWQVAKKMLSAEMPDSQIIAFTGLTQEQINRLKK